MDGRSGHPALPTVVDMFRTYLRRELANRRRQTVIVAIGMALAIALVIVVNAVAAGVKTAQADALKSVYGVGTDVTVTKTATRPTGTPTAGSQFDVGSGAGRTSGGTRTFSQSALRTDFGTTAFTSAAVTKAAATAGVKAATGTLALRSTTFSGRTPSQSTQGTRGYGAAGAGQGGPAGNGSSSFGISQISVLGYDTAASASVGPMTSVALSKGRLLTASDSGKYTALLDSDYATTAKKAVGDTVTLGGKSFTVVGIVKSTSTSGATASNTYIPLGTAQTLASMKNEVTTVSVQATSSTQIDAVQTALKSALGSSYTVNTEADLAGSVSGSLATAADLAGSLGLWLSLLVLAAAFLIAILFTVSGVTRRTREFGTLKAIGWSNRRVVGQVAGESLVQGLIGGVVGIVIGIGAIVVVNIIHPTLTAAASTTAAGGFGAAGGQGGFGRAAAAASTAASDIALTLPVTGGIIALAVGLAVVGGLLAGVFGGWRAASLRPAAALRSVA